MRATVLHALLVARAAAAAQQEEDAVKGMAAALFRTPRVVVIGGGLAGLASAIEAQRHGAHVTIVEKEASLGGNSAKATR
jgi:NADPH-dependent 2,4-dienoyl-CoA reductase/sulfur reductase-like enzyme